MQKKKINLETHWKEGTDINEKSEENTTSKTGDNHKSRIIVHKQKRDTFELLKIYGPTLGKIIEDFRRH